MSVLAHGIGPLAGVTVPPHVETKALEDAQLTRKEQELLSILMRNPGCCLSRETLLRTVWQYADGARTRTVDVHVQRLRRKLGARAASIKTIVRMGYCWFPEPESLDRPPAYC